MCLAQLEIGRGFKKVYIKNRLFFTHLVFYLYITKATEEGMTGDVS
jgi:hypothetical protein